MALNYLGKYWNNKYLDIYNIDNRNIVLNGWNGDNYVDCFELDKNLIVTIKNNIEVNPVYKTINDDTFIIDYKIYYN